MDPAPRAAAHVTISAGVLAAAAILAQIAYPLLDGAALAIATVVGVALFATAGVVHCASTSGPAAAARLVIVGAGIGLAVEVVGLRTGVPFGRYAYGTTLGPTLLGVPLVVPLAWVMIAYPCLVLARRFVSVRRPAGTGPLPVALIGAGAMTAWDVFLDPQMVAAGHWSWQDPEPGLPGVPAVPLSNFAGWFAVALVLIAALDRALPVTPGRAHGVPATLLAWTWLGSTVANLAFFGRPAVAGYGFVALGAFTWPYLAGLRGSPRGRGPSDARHPSGAHHPSPAGGTS